MTTDDTQRPNSIRKALALSFAQSFISLVFTFGSVVIVSHILTPAEIGVYSVAAGLVALVHMLRDFGLTQFLIQEETLNEPMIHTVFTINLALTWLLAAILVACSGFAGRFYGTPGVAHVLQVVAIVFVLMPFGVVAQTMMRRELEFGRLLKIRLGESITRSCATVGLAYAGFSYMSMAWASVIAAVVMVVGSALWGWRYRVKGLSLRYWKRALHFGSNQTIADIARQIGNQSASLVIGRMLGMAETGLYSRGYGVVNMYNDRVAGAITTVAFPAFAREHRDTGTAPQLFVRSLIYLTGISWPFFAAGILLAFPVIRILFGEQWDEAVPLMRWLCAAAIVATLTYQCNHFLVAMGRVTTVTRVEVQYQLVRVGITIAGAYFGLETAAAVQILVYVIAAALYWQVLRKYPELAVHRCVKALKSSAVVAVATCVVPSAVVFWPGFLQHHMIVAFLVAVIGGCVGWWLCVRTIRHPILEELRRLTRPFPRFGRLICGQQ